MNVTVTFSEIWHNKRLCDFFFREQSTDTLELLVKLSAMSGEKTIEYLDEVTKGMDLYEVEEMFYSYSAEDIAESFGIELKKEKKRRRAMNNRTFTVNVIGYNVETFMILYACYIMAWHEGWYDDRVFELEAPQEIYDEIAGLKEECIEIIED